MKSELAIKEETRSQRFDKFGVGAILTQRGQSYRGNQLESPQQHNFARQVNIKRSYPKYRWSESGALLSERREGLPIQWTERSSIAGTARITARSTSRSSSRRTARSTDSATLEELELQKKELLEKRLKEIEEMLSERQSS
jgi:hypothetical protein